jgi:hypothetical protein
MKVTEHLAGFYGVLRTNEHYRNIKVFANHHESFTHQGIKYSIHSPYEMFSKDSAFYRTIVNHSLVVYLNPQKTVLDEPLKSYEPHRFGIELVTNLFENWPMFQTRLLSARRKTTEILQDLH